MDWMGAQLAKLIEEGKRALQKEVVVMSEAKEDEEDDGSGMWEDEGHLPASSSGPTRSHKRPRHVNMSSPPPSYIPRPTTPRRNRFDPNHLSPGSFISLSPSKADRGLSTESTHSRISSHHHEDDSWQSPELRRSMEEARRRLMAQRNYVS